MLTFLLYTLWTQINSVILLISCSQHNPSDVVVARDPLATYSTLPQLINIRKPSSGLILLII